MRRVWTFLILCTYNASLTPGTGAQTAAGAIENLLPPGYDGTREPKPKNGAALVVGISWNIKGVYHVDFHEMSVLMAMYFRMRWSDSRLQSNLSEGSEVVPLHSDVLKRVWMPDLYVQEARDVTSFKMIQEVQGLYLHPPNTLVFSTMLQTKLACPMFFSRYPFDVQTCDMTVLSYKFGEDKLRLEWMSLGVTAEKGVDYQLPNYGFHVESDNITSKIWCENCTFAPTSIAKAWLIFERKYMAHLLTVYVPSMLFVAVAWASFFWPPEVIPGRTVLIITSLLTVISMYGAVAQKSPETSYLKAIDVWLFQCIVLVVLTLFQYAIIITIGRKLKERTSGEVFPVVDKWMVGLSAGVASCYLSLFPGKLYPCHKISSAAGSTQGGTGGGGCTQGTGGGGGGARQDQNDISNANSPPLSNLGDLHPSASYEAGGSRRSHRLALYQHYVETIGKITIPLLFFICNLIYWPIYLS